MANQELKNNHLFPLIIISILAELLSILMNYLVNTRTGDTKNIGNVIKESKSKLIPNEC